MTWSIVARDAQTGRLGIAVATCAFAVGARVPHIRSNTGAIATQALTNPYLGSRGLALLAAGASATDAVRMLLAADEGRESRQLHVLDKEGRSAAATGANCIAWCGHLIRGGFSVAGNMLAGPQVIEVTAETFERNRDLPFARRLLAAMHAGEAAGGDMRGRQSAALRIHADDDFPLLDLRVDDHEAPLDELSRLEAVARRHFVHYRRFSPSRDAPAGIYEQDALEAAIAQSIAEGYE